MISTAFRPTGPEELARNPFRVFVSLLVPEDRRFFDADLAKRLGAFFSRRRLFPDELLTLADAAEADGGLDADRADRFLDFLPRSAAGIFSSNLTSSGTVADTAGGAPRDAEWMSGAIGRRVDEPVELYEAQRAESLRQVAAVLGLGAIDPSAGALANGGRS